MVHLFTPCCCENYSFHLDLLTVDSGCGENKFQCNTSNLQRRCIWNSWVCDGMTDCPDGEDEIHCGKRFVFRMVMKIKCSKIYFLFLCSLKKALFLLLLVTII